MLRAASGFGRLIRARPLLAAGRSIRPPAVAHGAFSTNTPGDGADKDANPPAGDFEDEFEDMSFDIAATEEAPLQVDVSPETDEDLTPALASEMVARMVAAATSSPTGPAGLPSGVLPSITPHMVSVLRASRIQTNEVFAPGADDADYPINRKVVAVIDVARLGLSAPAADALRILAGARYKDGSVKVACSRFGTSAENQAFAVGRVETLVRAAREACGDPVDARELGSWEEITDEVVKQLGDDGKEMDFLMSRKIKPEETVTNPAPPSLQGQGQ